MPNEDEAADFMYGGLFLRRLVVWLNTLRWPVDDTHFENDAGISYAELVMHFTMATGTRITIDICETINARNEHPLSK